MMTSVSMPLYGPVFALGKSGGGGVGGEDAEEQAFSIRSCMGEFTKGLNGSLLSGGDAHSLEMFTGSMTWLTLLSSVGSIVGVS